VRESEQQIEWLFINLRWLMLLAVASIIGMDVSIRGTAFPRTAFILLIVGAVANLTVLIAALQNNIGRSMQNTILAYDIVLTLGFIAATRDLQAQLLFISLIPITTAALRISWTSSVIVTLGTVMAYWAITWMQGPAARSTSLGEGLLAMAPSVVTGAVLIVAGLAVGQIGCRIKQSLVQERRTHETESAHALRIAHQRARIVFDLASTLSATLNYERVLEAALDISRAGIPDFLDEADAREMSQVGMILLFGMDQTLYVAKARGISPREEQARFPASRGLLATAVKGTNPVVSNIPGEDPELGTIARIRECQQVIAVPLRAGFESFGLLVLGSVEPDLYTRDYRDLLAAICNQAVLALQNAMLYQNLMDEKDRLVTVEEDARKKLARDLHDGPTQTIAAIAMRLNYIRLLVDGSPEEALREIQQLEDLARRTTREIRQMLFTLRPLILESQGIVAALEQLRQNRDQTSPIPIHLQADHGVDRLLTKDAKGAIFYIVEEAFANARKHARARNIWIRLFQRGMSVVAEVEDDGRGFDVAALESDYALRGSLGLINLRERAVLVKGKTVITSSPGHGTTITVTVPIVDLPPEAVDAGNGGGQDAAKE
jgi:signal transduction histidine kinase